MRLFCQLWMFSIAAVLVSNANALVLGEIQVLSQLGQPLAAKIALTDFNDTDALQLETRLAGVEAYNKTDLQYPDGHKFRFQLINEQGTQPFIRVFTSQPIEEPFVNLLIEISSTSGKFIKAYTFLLDPSPSWPATPVTQPVIIQQMPQTAPRQAGTETESGRATDGQPASEKPARPASKRKKHKRSSHSGQLIAAQTQVTPNALTETAIQDRNPHMRLAMSLSISGHDPSASLVTSADALQEELIVKEKILEDLNVQINTMQAMIKSLQDKLKLTNQLSVDAGSGVSASGEAVSGTPDMDDASGNLHVAAPAIQPLSKPLPARYEMGWLEPALALAALLLGVAGFVWYRKYKQSHEWQHGPFDDVNEVPVVFEATVKTPIYAKTEKPAATMPLQPYTAELPVIAPLPAEKRAWPFGEQSMEIPAHTEQTSVPIVPPEYAMLLEAKKHLRSGNDKLAEEVLIQAIEANPKNTYGYLVLLSIYEKRGDTDSFAKLAQQLKKLGDDSSFKEAAEMGRKLDPGNSLYV